MKIHKTGNQGCFLIQPKIFNDHRGYFYESFNNQEFFNSTGRFVDFIQDNESLSSYGVIRGLHAQTGGYAQSKLIRVVQGKIKDIVIDMRFNSATFGHIVTRVLDAENKNQLFVPKGCLHGFSVLEDHTIVNYKCDSYFSIENEIKINPLDPDLNLDWGIRKGEELISENDEMGMSWREFMSKSSRPQRRECLIRSIYPEYEVEIPEEETEEFEEELFVDSPGPFISSAQGI